MLFLSGISAREPDGTVRGVSVDANGKVTTDVQEQTRGVLETLYQRPLNYLTIYSVECAALSRLLVVILATW